MIKTLIFDLGKVIVPFDFQRSYDRMVPLCGHSPDEIRKKLGACDLVARFEAGKVEADDFVNQVSKILGMEVAFEEFSSIFCSIFFPETLLPDELLESLGKRYRLVLLSNTNAIHFPMVHQNYPILRHFDELVLSYRVGATKPDPKIYKAAIDAAQCKPEECFFTDDIPAYVEGAKQLDIDAVIFEGRKKLEDDLRARGVAW